MYVYSYIYILINLSPSFLLYKVSYEHIYMNNYNARREGAILFKNLDPFVTDGRDISVCFKVALDITAGQTQFGRTVYSHLTWKHDAKICDTKCSLNT